MERQTDGTEVAAIREINRYLDSHGRTVVLAKCPQCRGAIEIAETDFARANTGVSITPVSEHRAVLHPSYIVCTRQVRGLTCSWAGDVELRT
jgi:hypothetical protein